MSSLKSSTLIPEVFLNIPVLEKSPPPKFWAARSFTARLLVFSQLGMCLKHTDRVLLLFQPVFISANQTLLERFEETLAEAAQDEDSEADYEGTNQEPKRSQDSPGWSLDQEGDQEPLLSERSQSPAEGHSRAVSQRSRLQDLLLTARKRASGCFGARMDRIGNASGLGCNNGRGESAAEHGRRKSSAKCVLVRTS